MAISIKCEKKIAGSYVSLSLESLKTRIGVLGGAGSGRSWLLPFVAGIEKPDKGKIQIHGKTVFDSERKTNMKPKDRNFGYLFQDYALFPNLSVEQNIACGCKKRGTERERKIEKYIRRFRLEGLEDVKPPQLTNLQKMRTALARILIGDPDFLLLDEPFYGMAGAEKAMLFQEMKEYLEEYEGGFLMVSSNPWDVYGMCEQTMILGEERFGDTKEVFDNPETVGAAYLTGCRNFSRVEILDEFHVRALDWGINLKTDNRIQKEITHIGIRDPQILSTDSFSQNCMPVDVMSRTRSLLGEELEVEHAEYPGDPIWMLVPSGTQDVKYVYFPPEALLLLRQI